MFTGIESTAHTFGVGISHKGKILANVRDMYRPLQGGIIPMDSAKHHRAVAETLWSEALAKARIEPSAIKGIAFSNAPGLAPCLLAGLDFVREKARALNLPVVPVNHCIAHLEIGRREGVRDPVLLYASGANTQIIAFVAGMYRVFGETLDMGIGNCLDTFARYAGIPFPGGPILEQKALRGSYVELPYSIKGMDVSFSGLLTKAKQLYDAGTSLEDISFSLQETLFALLVEAAERALAHTDKKELVLGGGVGCNARLQEMCRIMCAARKARFFCPAREFLVDNGAMIAYTGELMFRKKVYLAYSELDIKPRERTDEVKVVWR
jgi:glycoprotease/Kae1 family metallohydrolase